MLGVIFAFLILGGIAYLIKNPRFLGFVIIGFLSVISIFTPFWPFVLFGFIGMISLTKQDAKK